MLTRHALQRYRERVADLNDDAIAALLDTPAVRCAIRFGAPYVRLGTGQRLVINDGVIVTILPVGSPLWRCGVPKTPVNNVSHGNSAGGVCE